MIICFDGLHWDTKAVTYILGHDLHDSCITAKDIYHSDIRVSESIRLRVCDMVTDVEDQTPTWTDEERQEFNEILIKMFGES